MNQPTTQSKIKTLYELKTVNSSIGRQADFIARVVALNELQRQIADEFNSLKKAMKANRVKKIDMGKNGIIQFVPTPYYQIGEGIAPRFTKQAINSEEVRHYMHKHGDLPKGVIVKVVNKFYKGIK